MYFLERKNSTYNTKYIRITKTKFYSYKMRPCSSYLLIICGLSLAAGAPQGSSYPRVDCRTEYTTVWETEYEERETKECVTKLVPDCKMVFKMKCKPTSREVVSI